MPSKKSLLAYTFLILGMMLASFIFIYQDKSEFSSNQESLATSSYLQKFLATSTTTNTTKKYNLAWLENQIEGNINYTIDSNLPRLDAHIFTDKVIYRPSDVVFIEVLVVNTFNKTPIALDAKDQFLYQYYLKLEMSDPSGSVVYSGYNYVSNGTATFTYKVPSTAVSGEYQAKVYNGYISTATKIIRIRDYPRDSLTITALLNQDSYRPGDTVTGQLTVTNPTSSSALFTKAPTYTYSVSFNSSTITGKNTSTALDGTSVFTFVIPKNATTLLTTIAFIVAYQGSNQTYTCQLVITQPDLITIDFYSENGYLVSNVTNKIYFQAWATKDRADSIEIGNATLKLRNTNKSSTDLVLINSKIASAHKGKGTFSFKVDTPPNKTLSLYLEIPYQDTIITRNITLANFQNFNNTNEIRYTINNKFRVLSNSENLNVTFETNNLVNPNDTYILQVKMKENIIYQEQYQFNKSSNLTIAIKSSNFSMLNGGIYTLSLYRLTRDFIVFYDNSTKSISASSTKIISNTSQCINWLQPKGEILFIVKPSETLGVLIKTDKTTYAPGDLVNYELTVINRKTNKTVTDKDVLVSLMVTDETVFSKLQDRIQPPSFASAIYLENEVQKINSEFYNSNDYVNHWFGVSTSTSNDRNLDLLLGLQGWRVSFYDLSAIQKITNNIYSYSSDQQYTYSQLFGYNFLKFAYYSNSTQQPMNDAAAQNGVINKNAVVKKLVAAAGDSDDTQESNDVAPGDFMTGILSNTRYWAHTNRANFTTAERIDFTETLIFNSANRTKNGVLKGSFRISDLITKFRITVNSIDTIGRLGFNTSSFISVKSFYITFDAPLTMTMGDSLKIPLKFTNLNSFELSTNIQQTIGATNQIYFTLPSNDITVKSQSSQTYTAVLNATKISTQSLVSYGVSATSSNGNSYNEKVYASVNVIPKGYPRDQSFGGQIGSNLKGSKNPQSGIHLIKIPLTVESGSPKFTGQIFSSNYASLLEAVDKLIQEPNGCFEQTSATTYPMVMALQFLNTIPSQTDKVKGMKVQINNKLQKGYDKLVSFQTKEKGYEWFGASPAHEALSSYGLMQFTEMSKVTSFVDANMVSELKKWILSRKDGNGSFKKSTQALDSFGRAPDNITDAYIIWTLTSSGEYNVTTEITALQRIANQSIANNTADAYFLGLLSASLYNLNRTKEAQYYADYIRNFQLKTGNVTRSQTTITTSQGENKVIETTAMSTIAWMNSQSRYGTNITNAINWLISRVSEGAYGTTQGTILTLKALTSYMKNFATLNGNGTFVLRVNGTVAQKKNFTSETRESIEFDFSTIMSNWMFSRYFQPGQVLNLTVSLENFVMASGQTKDFLVNYAFGFNYYDTMPEPSSTVLGFKVKQLFDSSKLGADSMYGQIFTYNLTLTNLQNSTGLGMTVARLRIPSCLQIIYDYLEAMKRNKLVDYYEIRNSNSEIVFYWRQMAPSEVKTVSVNLIQRYNGYCYQKPHTAYPYYNDDQPVWVLPTK